LYEIVAHEGKTTFAYVLEVPPAPTDVQEAFNIEKVTDLSRCYLE